MNNNLKNEFFLKPVVIIISILVIISTLLGIISIFQKDVFLFVTVYGQEVEIFGGGVYRYHTVAQVYQAVPHDIVTLVFALPAFIYAYKKTIEHNQIWRLRFIAITLYLCFTYTIYTFLTIYNRLFLSYVGIMGLSFFTLLIMTRNTSFEEIKTMFNSQYKRQFNSWFLIIVPTLMAFVWLKIILPTALFGEMPVEVIIDNAYTLVPQAIDIAFIFPVMIYGGLNLRKDHPFGYFISMVVPFFLIFMMGAVMAKGLMLMVTNTMSAAEMLVFIGLFFFSSIILVGYNTKALKPLLPRMFPLKCEQCNRDRVENSEFKYCPYCGGQY